MGTKALHPTGATPTLSRQPLRPTGLTNVTWSVHRWGPTHTLVPSQAAGPGVGNLTQLGGPGRQGGSDLKVAEEVPTGVFWAPRCEDLEASGTTGAPRAEGQSQGHVNPLSSQSNSSNVEGSDTNLLL